MKTTIADLGSAYQYLQDKYLEFMTISQEEEKAFLKTTSFLSMKDNLRVREEASLLKIEKDIALHEAQQAETYLFEVIEKLIAQE